MNLKRLKDRLDITSILISLYKEELIAWYNYFRAIPFLNGEGSSKVSAEFAKIAEDELNDHAKNLLNRIKELGVVYDSSLEECKNKFVTLVTPFDVQSQLQYNLEAEERAISHYKEAINLLSSSSDTETVSLLKEILKDEEEHKTDLENLLNKIK